MSASIINKRQLGCMSCGATVEAACDCGTIYVPAGQRAIAAVSVNPEMSDRAIAAAIGVDHKTVAAARRAIGEDSPPEKRIGKDGKRYRAKPARPYDPVGDSRATFERQCYLSIMAAETATVLIHDCGEIDEELFTLADNAANIWRELAEKLSPTDAKPAFARGSAVKSAADRAEARSRAVAL
jgi:hypothetical protein